MSTQPLDSSRALHRHGAGALQAAHAAGIVHRDLNFVLAKLSSGEETPLTVEGALLGTFAYLAPEQLGAGEVDARADLWRCSTKCWREDRRSVLVPRPSWSAA